MKSYNSLKAVQQDFVGFFDGGWRKLVHVKVLYFFLMHSNCSMVLRQYIFKFSYKSMSFGMTEYQSEN